VLPGRQKTTGTLWIDRTDRELVKAEAEVFDTVNIGLGLLGGVGKGRRFTLQGGDCPTGTG
jgi:hypothetical protein